ncbi:ankyrin repeat-containing protein [Forsythia ovata]|uniref:Ankyrin repeat-containing protein n=1 Tax=Forsythia ovata TaxID=205694 RepID=A0ABD1WW28_9LAMI
MYAPSQHTKIGLRKKFPLMQEVEKFVLPQERKSKNSDGKTPLTIFNQEHRELPSNLIGYRENTTPSLKAPHLSRCQPKSLPSPTKSMREPGIPTYTISIFNSHTNSLVTLSSLG